MSHLEEVGDSWVHLTIASLEYRLNHFFVYSGEHLLKLPNVFFLDLRASWLRGRTLATFRERGREKERGIKRVNEQSRLKNLILT